MKSLTLSLIYFFLFQASLAQIIESTIKALSNETKNLRVITHKNMGMWDVNLYGAILMVDPSTRLLFANEPDSKGVLTKTDNLYTGRLPDSLNIANTSIDWLGKRWAMVTLPLPTKTKDRVNLLVHELFHAVQPSLGFVLSNPNNNHLDDKNGRIYLRLELAALRKAVQSTSVIQRERHVTNALIFRRYRHALYKGADSTENLLELNEGLAEYTGLVHSGRNETEFVNHFIHEMNSFLSNATFVRSFAYQTIPIYGYLLRKRELEWNKQINQHSNLTDYFSKKFNANFPQDLQKATGIIAKKYNYLAILAEETAREEKSKDFVRVCKLMFIESPHVEIKFERMNVSFDPRNVVPVEDKGTYYKALRITDNWGTLSVTKGALMGPSWDRINLTPPIDTAGKIVGDGWTLALTENYKVVRNAKTRNYGVVKINNDKK